MNTNSSVGDITPAALAAAMDRSAEDLSRRRVRPLDQVFADIHRRTASRLARRGQGVAAAE